MMRLQFHFDTKDIQKALEEILQTAGSQLSEPNKLFSLSRNEAGEYVLGLLALPLLLPIVEDYNRRGGESAEPVISEFYNMLALAYAMAGKKDIGNTYWQKAKRVRRGGKFAEACQSYYP